MNLATINDRELGAARQALEVVLEALQSEHGHLLERDVDRLNASIARKSAALAALARVPKRVFADPQIAERLLHCRSLNTRNAALLSIRQRPLSLQQASAAQPQISSYGRRGIETQTVAHRYSFGKV